MFLQDYDRIFEKKLMYDKKLFVLKIFPDFIFCCNAQLKN